MKKANNKKCIAVLSSAALGVLIASALTTNAHAAVNGYVLKDAGDASKVVSFDKTALLADYQKSAVGDPSPMFDAYMKDAAIKGNFVAFNDTIKGLVSYDAVMSAYQDAILNPNTNFSIDNFTETAADANLAKNVTVNYTENADGTQTAVTPVPDTESPVITLTGDATITLDNGTKYADAGATAKDNIDTDVKVTSVITDKDGKTIDAIDTTKAGTYTVTYSAVDAAGNKATAVTRTVTVKEAPLTVSSVSAINPKEIQVTFNQAVDEDSALDLNNYVISKNNSKYSDKDTDSFDGALTNALLQASPDNITLNAATNTVTFRLAAPLANADKYSIDVRDGVLSKDKSQKLTKYTDTQKTFTDVTAPKLLKSEVTATNNLKLTFDEPVAAGSTATIDGVKVLLAAPSTNIKTYTVQSASPLDASLRTIGNHAVSVYNVADVALPTPNSATILTGSFNVTADTTAPFVQQIVPVKNDDRSFDIVFSEPLKSPDATKLVVKKGNYTFQQTAGGASNEGSTTYSVKYAPLNDDGTTGILGNVVLNGTSQVVRVTFGADEVNPVYPVINPLYATSEASTALSVETDNYKDTADLVGAKYDGSVTLTKDLVGPKVDSQYDNSIIGATDNVTSNAIDGLLVAKFDKNLSTVAANTDKSKITVTDKDGITRTVNAATVANGDELQLQLTGLTDRDDIEAKAPYTVNFAAGAVKANNLVANEALTTTILSSNNIATPVAEAVTSSTTSAGDAITVTYNTEMTASAANLANYTLDTVAFPTGTTISMNGTNKAVTITLPEGYTNTNITKLLTISKNVITKSGSAVVGSVATKAPYTNTLNFTDNTKPTITDAKYLVDTSDQTTTSKIKVTFSENLGVVNNDPVTIADVKVLVNGAAQTVKAITDGTPKDKVVTLTLANPVNVAQAATISIVPVGTDNAAMNLQDMVGNTAKEGSSVTSTGNETDVDAAVAAQNARNVVNSIFGGNATATTTVDTTTGNVTVTPTVATTSTLSSIGAVSAASLTSAINNGAQSITLGANAPLSLTASTPDQIKTAVAQAVLGDTSKIAADFDTLTVDQLKAYANNTGLKVTVNGVAHTVTVQ